MRILLVEDEKAIASAIKEGLKEEVVIDLANTGKDGLYQAEINEHDVIVLDLGLPDTDGLTICQQLRKNGITTPILILTARSEIDDKVTSLDAGADDFLSKPFNLAELRARLRALMRRNSGVLSGSLLKAGDLLLDNSSYQVSCQGQPVKLRRKEFLLLEYLMRNVGKIVTRDMIFEYVWGGNSTSGTNTVDVHIKFLRDKVDKPYGTEHIKTIHGTGYRLDPRPHD